MRGVKKRAQTFASVGLLATIQMLAAAIPKLDHGSKPTPKVGRQS
jgi:hypothetical protein